MVKNCLMKLGLSWMLKHKERYVLSWISFGLISMFLIFVYSIAVGITSQVKDYASAFPEGSVSVDRMNEIASQYSIAGTVIASVFVVVCMVSLINSLLITIGENSAFMELFRLLGLPRNDYMFMTCFVSSIQGLIGGLLGVLFAFLLTEPAYRIVKSLDLKGTDILKELRIDPRSCVITLGICVLVSVISGLAAFRLSSGAKADAVADAELI